MEPNQAADDLQTLGIMRKVLAWLLFMCMFGLIASTVLKIALVLHPFYSGFPRDTDEMADLYLVLSIAGCIGCGVMYFVLRVITRRIHMKVADHIIDIMRKPAAAPVIAALFLLPFFGMPFAHRAEQAKGVIEFGKTVLDDGYLLNWDIKNADGDTICSSPYVWSARQEIECD